MSISPLHTPSVSSSELELSDEQPFQRPAIENYINYREYLKDLIAYLKETDPLFSYRKFSKKAGFSSPNFLKLVADNQRNLSSKSIQKFAVGLNLNGYETEVFEILVHFNQAESDFEKNRWYLLLKEHQHKNQIYHLYHHQFEVYSRWYSLILRELALLKEFNEDVTYLSRGLIGDISKEDVEQALEHLLKIGLLTRSESGQLYPTDPQISTGPEIQSLAIRNFHRNMLQKAIDSLDQIDQTQRNISGVTLGLSKENYQKVIQRIQQFRTELLNDFSSPTAYQSQSTLSKSHDQEIYHLSFTCIPTTCFHQNKS